MASTASISRKAVGISVTDIIAVLFIYLVPTISHLTAAPLYLLDPMRIAVLGALMYTRSWKNSLALAATLPLFSFFIGAHPVFMKSLLIAMELGLNVLLFVGIAKTVKNKGIAMFLSIIASKMVYYAFKAMFISGGLIQMSLVSTEIWIQLVVATVLSAGIWFAYRKTTRA